MVQNVSWEWLLEGFKYELEAVVKPKTVDYYYSHARVFTRWAQHRGQLANPHLTTKRHIQDFFHYLLYDWHTITVGNGANRQIHHTDRTRWHYYRSLRRFFSWAVKEGHLEHNPLDGIILTVPKPLQIEPYRPEHVEKMLAVLNHEWKVAKTARQRMLAARDHAVLLLFLESGLRLGELAGLRIGDIDLARQRVLVSDGKMGKGRIAGFGPQAKNRCGDTWVSAAMICHTILFGSPKKSSPWQNTGSSRLFAVLKEAPVFNMLSVRSTNYAIPSLPPTSGIPVI